MTAQTITKFPHAHPRLHVAILLDGNGQAGLRARGLVSARKDIAPVLPPCAAVVRAAPGLGIKTLTLYAFSSNWHRIAPLAK